MNEKSTNWLSQLRAGLAQTSEKITNGISEALTHGTLDFHTLQKLEETLISADMGVTTAEEICQKLSSTKFNKNINDKEIREALAEHITQILEPVAVPLSVDSKILTHVILVVGVNGSGKTTTIGKLAKMWSEEGKSVLLAAGDTFRAGAVDQLRIWGQRTGCLVFARDTGSDPAGLAFDAFELARRDKKELLLIDTAGRLQNREDLMDELAKIIRVLRKLDPTAPHSCILVLDATVGQNAHSQVEKFKNITEINGLILTKLAGTARGGVLVALAERFGLPVHAVGVGEGENDLRPFSAQSFARNLVGLNS